MGENGDFEVVSHAAVPLAEKAIELAGPRRFLPCSWAQVSFLACYEFMLPLRETPSLQILAGARSGRPAGLMAITTA